MISFNPVKLNIPLLLSVVFFGVFSHYFFWQVGDDGFIYFRYVERALNGDFGSWTDQVQPAEGFSSPLWYGLLTLISLSGIDIVLVSKLLGIFFSLLSLWAVYVLTHRLSGGKYAAGWACLVVSINAGFHYWSTAGLETPMYIALCLMMALSMITGRNLVLMLGLMSLARPEGPFLIVALIASLQLTQSNKLTWLSIFLSILPIIGWIGFRLYYYELPLPNTFYAKADGDKLTQFIRGIVYALPVLVPLTVSWVRYYFDRNNNHFIVLGMVNWLLVFIVSGGGDWMVHFRLLLPVVILLMVVMVAQIATAKRRVKYSLMVAFLPMLALTIFPSDWVKAFHGQNLDEEFYQEGTMTIVSETMAKDIDRLYAKKSLLIAVNHAGALPYWLSHDDFIDMVGLNNKTIAMAEGEMHKKYDIEYVFSKAPDLIILNTRIKPGTAGKIYHTGYWAGETALYSDPRFIEYYQFSGLSYQWHWMIPYPYRLIYAGYPESWILVYERKGIDYN